MNFCDGPVKRVAARIHLDGLTEDKLTRDLDGLNGMLAKHNVPVRLKGAVLDAGHQIGLCVEWAE